MLTNIYLRESKGKRLVGVVRTKSCMSTAGYNSENSEIHVRYARGRHGTALSCLTGCDHSFFSFWLLIAHDIAQGIQRGKGWWGTRWDNQGKATAVIPDNAARGSLLTWTAVELCYPAGA